MKFERKASLKSEKSTSIGVNMRYYVIMHYKKYCPSSWNQDKQTFNQKWSFFDPQVLQLVRCVVDEKELDTH